MTERLHIRPATEADLAALTGMTRIFNDYLDRLGGRAPARDAAEIAAAAMERLRPMAFGPKPLCTVLMAELAGRSVGYLIYHLGVYMDDATPVLHVVDFFVEESARRRGAGRALMLETRRISENLGASRLLWMVWRKNTEAIAFYESLGAVADAECAVFEWRIN